jgi:predicted dehydrogenase
VYRLALLSNAMHQNNSARVFAPHARVRMTALVDEPDVEPYVEARNRRLAERYGLPYFDSLAALGDLDVDAVSVGAEIERRGRLAAHVASLGKHLWLDKPPAATHAEADALAAAVERSGVQTLVMSGVTARWCARARQQILEGAVGEVLALQVDVHFAKARSERLSARKVPAGVGPEGPPAAGSATRWTFRDASLTDPTESSHHVVAKRELFEIGWYALALVHFLTGRRLRRVYASTGAYFSSRHRELDVEDFAVVALELEGGAVASVSAGRTGRASHAGHGPCSRTTPAQAGASWSAARATRAGCRWRTWPRSLPAATPWPRRSSRTRAATSASPPPG